MKGRGEVFFFLSFFLGETEKKTLGNKRFEKKNTQKENGNDNISTDIADLALVRGLDGCFGCGGEDNKC